MSEWYEAKQEDLELCDDTIEIQCEGNKFGNVYVVVKISDVKRLLAGTK